MALPFATVGAKITAALYNAIINAINPLGQALMLPTSIAVGSGTSSLSALGKVTFTGASSVSLNGCFTATFDNYDIILDISASSASSGGGIRLRAGGTDDASANYVFLQAFAAGSTMTVGTGSGQTQWGFAAAAGTEHMSKITICAPFIARATKAQVATDTWTTTTPNAQTRSTLRMTLTNSYDGFSVIPSTGTITGTLRVYGWNNG